MVEKSLGYLFITSDSSHFFDENDFEQYLFKRIVSFLLQICDSLIILVLIIYHYARFVL